MSIPLIIVAAIVLMSLRTMVIAGTAFYLVCRKRLLARYRIYRCGYCEGQWQSELRATLLIIPFDACLVVPAHVFGWIRPGPIAGWSVAASFTLMFVWFEVWFYFTHRLLHTRAFYFIHRQHHVAKVTSPLSALSFSYLERAILVGGAMGFSVAASQLIPLALPGIALYFFANYLINVLGHSNLEVFPARFTRSPWGRWLITPTYHALHHARHRGHYGLFTQCLDRAFETVWPDYEKVQQRAASGEGLSALHERL